MIKDFLGNLERIEVIIQPPQINNPVMSIQTLTAIIVEDEERSQKALITLLSKHHPDIKLLGSANNVEKAYTLLIKKKPDIVFLDIQLPDGLGFDLLERFEKPPFHIIFTTAYDQYALTAIKFGALDYVLKPIDQEELDGALEKTREKQKNLISKQQLQILFETFNNIPEAKLPSRISISTSEGIIYRPVKDIIRLEAQANYTKFYFSRDKDILASTNLGEYEDQFEPYQNFMRVHRSHLINLHFVDTFKKTDGGYLLMKDKVEVSVSRLYKDRLLERLEYL